MKDDDFNYKNSYIFNMIGESFRINNPLTNLEESVKSAIDSIISDNKFHFGTFISGYEYIAIVKKYTTADYAVAIFFAYSSDGCYFIQKSMAYWGAIKRLDS